MPFNAIRAFPVCAALVALALAALAMPAQAQFNPRDTRVLMPPPDTSPV